MRSRISPPGVDVCKIGIYGAHDDDQYLETVSYGHLYRAYDHYQSFGLVCRSAINEARSEIHFFFLQHGYLLSSSPRSIVGFSS